MKLVVGLGNPGPKYEVTRHNVGFLVLDLLAEEAGIEWQGNRFGGIWAKGRLFGEDCILLKPQTFMNRSGEAVAAAQRFFKIAPSDTIVLFDDIDMESGKVRAREGGGSGGHNGIKSIIAETGNGEFHRIKVGVGRPTAADGGPPTGSVSDWVLSRMSDAELLALQDGVQRDVSLRLKGIFERTS